MSAAAAPGFFAQLRPGHDTGQSSLSLPETSLSPAHPRPFTPPGLWAQASWRFVELQLDRRYRTGRGPAPSEIGRMEQTLSHPLPAALEESSSTLLFCGGRLLPPAHRFEMDARVSGSRGDGVTACRVLGAELAAHSPLLCNPLCPPLQLELPWSTDPVHLLLSEWAVGGNYFPYRTHFMEIIF